MTKFKKFSTILASSLLTIVASFCLVVQDTFAAAFSVSPTHDKISLTPGETYYGSFAVANPGTNTEYFSFQTSVAPFTNDENSTGVHVSEIPNNYNKIVDWITILDGEGTIAPNNKQDVHYVINVPPDAPAGGQYGTIIVESATGEPVEGALNIQQQVQIAYLIYADIAGETIHDGTIESANVSSFLLSGNIEGTSLVTNDGNVHAVSTYKLQVFPLFSSEEIYTNEENPDTALVMPEASIMKTTSWDNTPDVGIFNVKYTVEFEGETTTVEKMVIKCPIWLLFIIIFAIIALIIWLVIRSKNRKKAGK